MLRSPIASVMLANALLVLPLLGCGEPDTNLHDGPSESELPSGDDADGNDSDPNESGLDQLPDGKPNGDGDASDQPICETLKLQANPSVPRVLIVVDRSGSMAGERWDQVIASVDRVVAKFSSFEFGLALYPAVGEELTCQAGEINVSPASGTASAMHDVLYAESSRAIADHGYTPTAATLREALDRFAFQLDEHQARYVLLVTDGQPNCKLDGPEKYTADVDATLSALDALSEEGAKTFVLGYRTEDVAEVMNQMAAHGDTGQHYPVEDEETFAAAFGEIGQQLMPCTFELEQTPPGIEYVRVQLDGESLPALGPTGFTLQGERSVELGAERCAKVRDGGVHTVEVFVECEPIHLL